MVAPLGFRVDDKGRVALPSLQDAGGGSAYFHVGDDQIAVEGLVGKSTRKLTPCISRASPAVSNRWAGSSTQRTRFPRAFDNASSLVVRPPFDLPVARR